MFGKFLSKALLPVLMDKSARENLNDKKNKKKKAARKPVPSPAPEPQGVQGQSKSAGKTEPRPRATPPGGAATEDVHQLIMDSLKAAEDELEAKPEITSERQALIQQALDIQRSKEHVLDDLSQHEREKLYVMALKSLDIED